MVARNALETRWGRVAGLAVAAGLAAGTAACTSHGGAPARNPTTKSAYSTSPVTTAPPASTPPASTPSASPTTPRADAAYFSVAESFPGGAQWTADASIGSVAFYGPAGKEKERMSFVVDTPQTATNVTPDQEVLAAAHEQSLTVDQGPLAMTVQGEQASAVQGHYAEGSTGIIIVSDIPAWHGQYLYIMLTCPPNVATADTAKLQVLLHSLMFE